jgi:hypothetical protein
MGIADAIPDNTLLGQAGLVYRRSVLGVEAQMLASKYVALGAYLLYFPSLLPPATIALGPTVRVGGNLGGRISASYSIYKWEDERHSTLIGPSAGLSVSRDVSWDIGIVFKYQPLF